MGYMKRLNEQRARTRSQRERWYLPQTPKAPKVPDKQKRLELKDDLRQEQAT